MVRNRTAPASNNRNNAPVVRNNFSSVPVDRSRTVLVKAKVPAKAVPIPVLAIVPVVADISSSLSVVVRPVKVVRSSNVPVSRRRATAPVRTSPISLAMLQ